MGWGDGEDVQGMLAAPDTLAGMGHLHKLVDGRRSV